VLPAVSIAGCVRKIFIARRSPGSRVAGTIRSESGGCDCRRRRIRRPPLLLDTLPCCKACPIWSLTVTLYHSPSSLHGLRFKYAMCALSLLNVAAANSSAKPAARGSAASLAAQSRYGDTSQQARRRRVGNKGLGNFQILAGRHARQYHHNDASRIEAAASKHHWLTLTRQELQTLTPQEPRRHPPSGINRMTSSLSATM
jgi:hypothetical protein